jgi:hypothetical protein
VARHWQRCILKMLVFCAWCQRDGKPGYLGEREPLENPAPTHGICASHKERLLESFPSRSFPDAELLIVVHRNDTALYEYLQRFFADVSGVKVLVDRRVDDRRSAPRSVVDERRYVRARIRQGAISPLGGYTIVRFTPKETTTPRLERSGASNSPSTHPI